VNASGAVNVSIETNVITDFLDEINTSTVEGNITLEEQDTGTGVNGTFSYETIDANTTVIFKPDENLTKETTYDFTITVFVKNVTGFSYFSTAYTISFTTEPFQNGTISGYILDASNGTGIVGANVTVALGTFEKWTLSGSGGYYEISVPQENDYTVEADGTDVHYDIGAEYGINVTEFVTLENINISLPELPQQVEVEVKTRNETLTWDPAQGATDVLLSTDIRIGFLEPMDFDTVMENITLLQGLVEVTGNLSSPDNTTFYFDPTDDLLPDSDYELMIGTGIVPMNTSQEPPLWRDLSFEFTTRLDPIDSVSPSDGAKKVAINTVITVTFNFDINGSTVEGGISVDDADDNPVTGTVDYDNTTLTATFTPDADLEGYTVYTVYLSDIIMDLNGLTIFPPDDFPDMYQWTFLTKSTNGLLNVTVTDKNSAPQVGVTLTITQGSTVIDTQYTSQTGFRSFQLLTGTYNVTASLLGYQEVTESNIVITAGGVEPLGIRLYSETGSIRGTIQDADGNAVPGISVIATQNSSTMGTDNTDANGDYQITGLLPGSYNITATGEGYDEVVIANVLVTADQQSTESFTIVKTAPPADDDDDDDEGIDLWIIILIIIIVIIVIIILAVVTRKKPEVEEAEEAEPSYGAVRGEPYQPTERPSPSTYRELEDRAGVTGAEPSKPKYYGRCPDCMHQLIGSTECFHCAVRATYEVQEPPYLGYYE
jgi:hypothetical protein